MGDHLMIEIVNHKFLSSCSLANFEDLFAGFEHMRAITYSCTIDFIARLLKVVNNIEVIIGSESTLSARHQVLFDNNTIYMNPPESTIQKAIYSGALTVGISEVASHEKIYLLDNSEGKTRVILGSANLSSRAFEGGQRENICVLDDTAAFSYYSGVLDTLLFEKKNIKLYGKGHWAKSKTNKIEQYTYEPHYLYIYSRHNIVRKELSGLQFVFCYYGYNEWTLDIPDNAIGALVTTSKELVQLSTNGYMSKVSHNFDEMETYKSIEEIASIFIASNQQMLIVTQNGRISRLKPDNLWTGRNKHIVNLDFNDQIIATIGLQSECFDSDILIATALGSYLKYPIRRIRENPIRSRGSKYMSVSPFDHVIGALILSADVHYIFTVTKHGKIKRVHSDNLSKRVTPRRQGARLLSLSNEDTLCAICADSSFSNILVICNKNRYVLKSYSNVNCYGLIAQGDMLLDSAHLKKHPTTMLTACMVPDVN